MHYLAQFSQNTVFCFDLNFTTVYFGRPRAAQMGKASQNGKLFKPLWLEWAYWLMDINHIIRRGINIGSAVMLS